MRNLVQPPNHYQYQNDTTAILNIMFLKAPIKVGGVLVSSFKYYFRDRRSLSNLVAARITNLGFVAIVLQLPNTFFSLM